MRLVLFEGEGIATHGADERHGWTTRSRLLINPLQVVSVLDHNTQGNGRATIITLSNRNITIVPLAFEVVAGMINDAARRDDSL